MGILPSLHIQTVHIIHLHPKLNKPVSKQNFLTQYSLCVKLPTHKKSFMQTKKLKKKFLTPALVTLAASATLIVLSLILLHPNIKQSTSSISVKQVTSEILANGTVSSQNQATLAFLTSGRLTYLPFKEGDSVSQGQTIANLDTYALQRQVEIAANAYKITVNSTDQTQENFQAGIIEGQQRLALDQTNKNDYSAITEAQVVTDTIKRIVDNSQITKNSAQLNVDLANYAESLATLTSPINGIITRQDVNVSNVNVTPSTMFVVSDPSAMVFRAQVSDQDIDFVSVGTTATVHINGNKQEFTGTIIQIHPQKQIINGQGTYMVDIAIQGLQDVTRLDQGGFAKIKNNTNTTTKLVPVWVVLDNQYVWVKENGKNALKHVTVGKIHGNMIEVLDGLNTQDTVIVNPESVISSLYSII